MSDDISQLRVTLEQLKSELNHRINTIETRLSQLEASGEQSLDISGTIESQAIPPETETQQSIQASAAPQKPASAPAPPPTPRQPFFKPLVMSLIEQSPLGGALNWLSSHYQTQKAKGNGTVFLLTGSGILISVVGFGYLLQYMIGHLPPLLRVSFGYLATAAIFAIGLWLKSHARLSFSTAIIGLALLLGQTNVFFTGPYFDLISPSTSFLLFTLFTGLGYLCTYWLHAQTLAMIALLGGLFLPWLAHAPEAMTLPFTAYLLILNIATLHLANHLKIKPLLYAATTLSPLTLQAQLMLIPNLGIGFLLILHGFFLLYTTALFRDLSHRVTSKSLSLVSANLIFFIFASIQWFDSQAQAVSWIPYTLLAALFCFIAYQHYIKASDRPSGQHQHPILVLSILQAGALGGVALIALLGLQGSGAIGCMEAWLLITIGCQFRAYAIRIEGYIIFAIALAMSLLSIFPWIATQQFSIRPEPLYFASIGIAAFLIIKALTALDNKKAIEEKCLFFFHELFSFWQMFLVYGLFWFFAPQWLLVAGSLLIPLVIIRHAKYHLPISQISLLLHYCLLTLQWIISAEAAGTLSLRALDIYGQAALLIGFLYLYLIPRLYEKYLLEGTLKGIMIRSKVLFYLLVPLFYLPSIARHYEPFLSIALWVSVGIALWLYHEKPKKVMGMELNLLVGIAVLMSIIYSFESGLTGRIGQLSHWLGLAIFIFIIARTNAYRKPLRTPQTSWSLKRLPQLKPLIPFSYYWVGFLIFLLTADITQHIFIGLLAAMLYSIVIIVQWSKLLPLRYPHSKHLGIHLQLLWFGTLICALSVIVDERPTFWALLSAMIGTATLLFFHYGKLQHRKLLLLFGKPYSTVAKQRHLILLHMTLFFTYWAALTLFTHHPFGPGLTIAVIIHFIGLLFFPAKGLVSFTNKLAMTLFGFSTLKTLFFDLKDFSIIEKIICFIAIGILLLVASYQYQNRRSLIKHSGEKHGEI